MIPLKLTLKNFLSYGSVPQTIDFGRYPLICLSGRNGNGKSGMLDAITWALWGDARKISGIGKPDAGLLRLGQSQMMVVLEFEFNSSIYRVRREFSKSYGKQYANLDLEIFDEAKDGFVSLTDKTIRVTQDKISQLLGLDFETFTNSAFLRQGQSNEFSKKSPKERKQIIASILGLSRFDLLKSKALDHVKKYNDEKALLLKLQEHVSLEFCRKNELLGSLEIFEMQLFNISEKLSLFEKTGKELEQKWLESREQINVLELLNRESENLNKIYKQDLADLAEAVSYWRRLHAQFINFPNINLLEEEFTLKIKEEEQQRVLQQKSLELQETILKQKEVFNTLYLSKKEELQKNLYSQTRSLDLLDLEFKTLEKNIKDKLNFSSLLRAKIDENKAIVLTLEKLKIDYSKFQEDLSAKTAQFEKRRSYYQVLVQKGNWVSSALGELKLKKSTMHDNDDPSCPLCEQVLTIKRKQFLSKKFSLEEKFLTHRYARISKILSRLKEILLDQNEELRSLGAKNELFKDQILKMEEIKKNITLHSDELLALEKEISTLSIALLSQEEQIVDKQKLIKKEEDNLEEILKNDALVLEHSKSLKATILERETLNYNQALHQRVKEELSVLKNKLNELKELQKAFSEQDLRKEKISLKVKRLKEIKKSLSDYYLKTQKLNLFLDQIAKIEQERIIAKKEFDELTKQKQDLFKEIINVKNQLSTIERLSGEFKARADKIKSIENEVLHYQTLALAFGKDGIQALLIEEAIPEIEQEANLILGKITENKSQIFIESLRDLKKGGVKETLDIQISDSSGIRPYEMFSGGEAFRIDFALRIAMSKLLARRAGTALQTLIIDEGFGSQDEDGLSYLMDAIYAIQKDFSKVIVVSHLPIFKDNFPIHFVVEKTASGSQVQVLERG